MLAFTLRMIISDIQKSFRGFWIIFYFFFLGIITVLPFIEEDFYALYYLVIILFSTLAPHITKMFYVLPFGNKFLRRYLHLRAILLSSIFIITGTIISLLSLRLPVPNLERGWLVIMSYVMICILMSLSIIGESTKVNNKKNKTKNTIALVFVIIMLSGSFISAIFLINFKIQLLISILSVITSEALLIIGLRKVNLMDYVEPVYYGILTKAWRNQRIKQFANSKRGKI